MALLLLSTCESLSFQDRLYSLATQCEELFKKDIWHTVHVGGSPRPPGSFKMLSGAAAACSHLSCIPDFPLEGRGTGETRDVYYYMYSCARHFRTKIYSIIKPDCYDHSKINNFFHINIQKGE